MFLAVQLESRLIYCLNKACLTASASVISHRTVLTGSRPLGSMGWGGGSVQPLFLCLSLSLEQWWKSTAGALLSLTLNGGEVLEIRSTRTDIFGAFILWNAHMRPSEGHLVHGRVKTLHLSYCVDTWHNIRSFLHSKWHLKRQLNYMGMKWCSLTAAVSRPPLFFPSAFSCALQVQALLIFLAFSMLTPVKRN